MARERKRPEDEAAPVEAGDVGDDEEEIHDEDFQFVLRELLAAYEPILAEELEQARDAGALKKEALEHPPSCEDEFELAERIFERFFNEESHCGCCRRKAASSSARSRAGAGASRTSAAASSSAGSSAAGRARSAATAITSTVTGSACGRRSATRRSERALTEEERDGLPHARGGARRRVQAVPDRSARDGRVPARPADEIFAGTGRLQRGRGGVGRDLRAAADHRHRAGAAGPEGVRGASRSDPSFWFCRCWCLCAIRFGCCLARARSRCATSCAACTSTAAACATASSRCAATSLHRQDCASRRQAVAEGLGARTAVQIVGTAAGSFFDHYSCSGGRCESPTLVRRRHGWNFPSDGIALSGRGPTGPAP